MTEPEKIAILAKHCGFKIESSLIAHGWLLKKDKEEITSFWWNENRFPTLLDIYDKLPAYFNDLNATNEAENSLTIDQQHDYGENLRKISKNIGERGGHFVPNGFGCYALAHLSASERAHMLLVTWGEMSYEEAIKDLTEEQKEAR